MTADAVLAAVAGLVDRVLAPSARPPALELLVVVAAVAVVVLVPRSWRVLRHGVTIVHEAGHGFKQCIRAGDVPAGLPAHGNQYESAGSHCNTPVKKCLMYESGPQRTAIHRFCDVCHPYVVVQDMSALA